MFVTALSWEDSRHRRSKLAAIFWLAAAMKITTVLINETALQKTIRRLSSLSIAQRIYVI